MTHQVLEAVRVWAEKNAAGWVLERLYDERSAAVRGPLADKRCCDLFAEKLARQFGWIK